MNLYLIWQDENKSYDTYDSAVVCAVDETAARNTHPGAPSDGYGRVLKTWCSSPDFVKVKFIGVAADGIDAGVVCASFNAG